MRAGERTSGWRAGLRAIVAVALAGGVTQAARAMEAPCSVEVAVEVRGEAAVVAAESGRALVVGEQVVYRARVERSAEASGLRWVDAPSFPDFRALSLPGAPESAEHGPADRIRHVSEQRHAVYPARAGALVIPAASIRCSVPGSSDGHVARTHPLILEVHPPPARGRPDDYAGLVGEAHFDVRAAAEHVLLGESVDLLVTLRGDGNPWAQPAPTQSQLSGPGSVEFDVYPQAAKETLVPGPRMGVRTSRTLTLVPKAVGVLRIPSLRIVSYRPELGQYIVSSSAPIDVRVAAPNAALLRAPSTSRLELEAASGGRRPSPWIGVAIALCLALGVLHLLRRHGKRRTAPLRRARQLAGEAREAALQERARALDRALRAALAAHTTDAAADTEPGTALREALRRIEALRFDPDAGAVVLDAIQRLLEESVR